MGRERPVVQFLDDEPAVLEGLRRLLRHERTQYDFAFATDPFHVLERALAGEIDVLISDINMRELGGFELLARIRASVDGRRLPVIFLTGRQETDLKRRALDLDATDVLNKPIEIEELLARVRSAVRIKEYADQLRDQNAALERRVRERTAALEDSQREIVWRLAKAGELRDEQTGNHVVRVGWFSYYLAGALGLTGRFTRDLLLAAPLHDVGKIGIPDAILRKRGPLSVQERAHMQQHCRIGEAILRGRPGVVMLLDGGESPLPDRRPYPLLETAARIALSHHERWDGLGYPSGLQGPQTPIEARIVAVADVFDALCSARPYKPPYGVDTAVELIAEQSGAQFDPQVVEAFHRVLPQLRDVQAQLPDEQTEPVPEEVLG